MLLEKNLIEQNLLTFACYAAHMTLTLSPQLEAWVSTQIKTGAFEDPNQVLTEALELLKMRVALENQSAFLSQDIERRAALRELVEQGQQLGMDD